MGLGVAARAPSLGVGAPPPTCAKAVAIAGRPAVAPNTARPPQTASTAKARQPPTSKLRERCEAAGLMVRLSMRVLPGGAEPSGGAAAAGDTGARAADGCRGGADGATGNGPVTARAA